MPVSITPMAMFTIIALSRLMPTSPTPMPTKRLAIFQAR